MLIWHSNSILTNFYTSGGLPWDLSKAEVPSLLHFWHHKTIGPSLYTTSKHCEEVQCVTILSARSHSEHGQGRREEDNGVSVTKRTSARARHRDHARARQQSHVVDLDLEHHISEIRIFWGIVAD